MYPLSSQALRRRAPCSGPATASHKYIDTCQCTAPHEQRSCEGEGDVVGVEAPLGGVAQVIFHGVQVVEVGVQVRVHQDRGVEEDGEGQVEVEREVEEVREKRTYT